VIRWSREHVSPRARTGPFVPEFKQCAARGGRAACWSARLSGSPDRIECHGTCS
jgi:hypothetical protein